MTLPRNRPTDIMPTTERRVAPAVESRVLEVLLRHVGPEAARPIAHLREDAGLDAPTFRLAMAALDGRRVLLGRRARGIFVCETPDQATGFTADLLAYAASIDDRVARRRAFVPPDGGAVEEERRVSIGTGSPATDAALATASARTRRPIRCGACGGTMAALTDGMVVVRSRGSRGRHRWIVAERAVILCDCGVWWCSDDAVPARYEPVADAVADAVYGEVREGAR